MTAAATALRRELIGLGGIVERNVYLTKRYLLWDVAFMIWTKISSRDASERSAATASSFD